MMSLVVIIALFVTVSPAYSSASGKDVKDDEPSREPEIPKDIGDMLQKRIINGEIAQIRYPWMVSVQSWQHTYWEHHCAGSVIASKWILTAAHCVVEYKNWLTWIRVHAGRHHLYGELDRSYEEHFVNLPVPDWDMLVGVKQIIIHEAFNEDRPWEYDIGLLELDQELVFNDKIRPIPIMITKNCQDVIVPEGSTSIALGWGKDEGGDLSDELRVLQLQTYSTKRWCIDDSGLSSNTCEQDYYIYLTSSDGKGGMCNGDSGGPLSYQIDGTWYLAGISSWGSPKCFATKIYPNVFTKVSYFWRWVYSRTGKKEPDNCFPHRFLYAMIGNMRTRIQIGPGH